MLPVVVRKLRQRVRKEPFMMRSQGVYTIAKIKRRMLLFAGMAITEYHVITMVLYAEILAGIISVTDAKRLFYLNVLRLGIVHKTGKI